MWRARRGGISLMEFAIVIAIMAVLLTLLLQRLGESAREARRVQLRMAVEADPRSPGIPSTKGAL